MELFLREDGSTVVRIDSGIVAISLFWIDIPMAGKGIGFGAKTSRVKANEKVDLTKVFGLADLSAS